MSLKDELKAYQARWAKVEAIVEEERSSASIPLRWQQLNAAVALAIGLDLPRMDSGESEVVERWVKLKEKAASRPSKEVYAR